MKYFLFLILHICFFDHLSGQSKTPLFIEYQSNQSYKGIKFGSPFESIKAKMDLGPSQGLDNHEINNKEYLIFNDEKFKEGQAYFTKSGFLYQVCISINDSYSSAIVRYNNLKAGLIKLFGQNDKEFTDLHNNSTNKSLNITWEGINLNIILHLDPDYKNNGRVGLIIIHEKLHSLWSKEFDESVKKRNSIPGI